ncbi:MAG: hypothetical protein MI700_05825, partial [Balneolales bacterium]|nr:hypothetical protein [Balneolales bacterium]
RVDENLLNQIDLKALVLYPAASTRSEFIWISELAAPIEEWAPDFYLPLEQNYYSFNEITVHQLHIGEFTIFAAQAHNWLLLSTSSRAVESSLRSYLNLVPSSGIDENLAPGQLVMNTEQLDHWIQQFLAVSYRPNIMGSFVGIEPVSLAFQPSDEEQPGFEFTGTLSMKDTTRAILMDALTYENQPISLDRYIAANAAAFTIFRLPPKQIPQLPEFNPSPLDSLLIIDNDLYRDIALSLDDEFAVVAFPESGLLANGEFLFIRNLESAATLQRFADSFAEEGLAIKQGESYYLKSAILAELIGSEMSPFSDFYLSFSRDVAVISKRRGLSESVEADRTRRRTIFYDETYSIAKRQLPGEVSGLVWAYSSDFLKFMDPFLMGGNKLGGLIGPYDIVSMSFARSDNSNAVNFRFNSISEEGSIQPYDELWVLPMSGEGLSGEPVVANIVGSTTEEIIFSTTEGKVEALAFDGTSVMRAQTAEGDVPVGSPVLYDWYGNGQPIIMLAAGTKIYAWNEIGNRLPQFPIEIGERISAPIVVTDVLRNGIPEIIVATENRRIHVIDGRGQNVRGWPQFTNSVVTQAPVFEEINGQWSIWVYSQNILHSWLRNGLVRPGFPTFINSSFTSAPTIFEDQILGSAADGYIYSIGESPSFRDSLAIRIQMDSISIKSLYATSSPLNKLTVQPNVLLRDSTGFYRSDLFVTQSANGSVLMFNPDGELEVTHSLGQPASATMTPLIIDLNKDSRQEVVALADFGRLFAWELLTGQRIFSIPTSGMTYPIIADLNNDGLNELIALTREGLRCWTINKPE